MAIFEDDQLTDEQRRRLDRILKPKRRFTVKTLIFFFIMGVIGVALAILISTLMKLFAGVILVVIVTGLVLSAFTK